MLRNTPPAASRLFRRWTNATTPSALARYPIQDSFARLMCSIQSTLSPLCGTHRMLNTIAPGVHSAIESITHVPAALASKRRKPRACETWSARFVTASRSARRARTMVRGSEPIYMMISPTSDYRFRCMRCRAPCFPCMCENDVDMLTAC